MMQKILISVLGQDRPGIIAAVSRTLFQLDCNIENVSQTILQCEFAGLFIVMIPTNLTVVDLENRLNTALAHLNLHIHTTCLVSESAAALPEKIKSEPFVITTKGADRKGLVAEITEIIARYGVNVTNLQAAFKGGPDPENNLMIYEVDVPLDTDQQALCRDLRKKSESLGLEISIQHRLIFEVLHRI